MIEILRTPTAVDVREGATVALDPQTVAELRRHRARQLRERVVWGEGWTDSGLVFTRENGAPLHPQSISQAFEYRVKTSGVPRVRLHDVRHTRATLGLAAGCR